VNLASAAGRLNREYGTLPSLVERAALMRRATGLADEALHARELYSVQVQGKTSPFASLSAARRGRP